VLSYEWATLAADESTQGSALVTPGGKEHVLETEFVVLYTGMQRKSVEEVEYVLKHKKQSISPVISGLLRVAVLTQCSSLPF
jgi:hypothetical protein